MDDIHGTGFQQLARLVAREVVFAAGERNQSALDEVSVIRHGVRRKGFLEPEDAAFLERGQGALQVEKQ